MLIMNFLNSLLTVLELLFVFSNFKPTHGRGFPDEGYYSNNDYDNQEAIDPKIKIALGKLEHAPQWVPDWPDSFVKMGQVSGVALDNTGQLLVFHRAGNQWDASTFTPRHVYQRIGDPPIPDPTILVFNETGELVDMWGQNLFYMPHGITVDRVGNVWVTDVALHQVFKFTPTQRQKPALTLGEKFIPGNDDNHFCKPSAVAVLSTGDFFVADGYCNHRIIKYSPDGTIILQWGKRSGRDPFTLDVPHALALAEDRGQVCVADRERGRVACFRADNGTYSAGYRHWLIGSRLFSVAYSRAHGGRLYVVNGPYSNVPVRGYVIDFTSGRLIQTFAPEGGFRNPHDIVVTPDGVSAYVAELDPHRVCKFVDEGLRNQSKLEKVTTQTPVKPTATIEVRGRGGAAAWAWWAGAGWAGAGAAAAALAALAVLALLRARNTGRKGITRRRWEYGHGEFKLRRLLERRRFTRVHSDDSDDEPAPMLPPQPPANA
ncbi:peptidyl-alpha-hydroxyglycine alpha-amidating lyase 1-like isoform X2 [Galleria mellonella]|uniref:peptidylamidoglycolate lyase n=1 Tax=Galleria mellonella TaxID=7137 RepID=A0ABM3MG75_GALME|nr:peptidyl-alpha-hydroxyglycine alpha-amidating lyase 1-like isoform X2 [Galleria mellonella]